VSYYLKHVQMLRTQAVMTVMTVVVCIQVDNNKRRGDTSKACGDTTVVQHQRRWWAVSIS